MFAISGKSFNSFLLGDVLFILNITTSVEPSLIFLVTKNLFFFQLLRVLWDLHRAFDPFHLLVYMHVSFIHSNTTDFLADKFNSILLPFYTVHGVLMARILEWDEMVGWHH